MISAHLLNLELPIGNIPEPKHENIGTALDNDAWQMENERLRRERGDFSRSETPVNVMFEFIP